LRANKVFQIFFWHHNNEFFDFSSLSALSLSREKVESKQSFSNFFLASQQRIFRFFISRFSRFSLLKNSPSSHFSHAKKRKQKKNLR